MAMLSSSEPTVQHKDLSDCCTDFRYLLCSLIMVMHCKTNWSSTNPLSPLYRPQDKLVNNNTLECTFIRPCCSCAGRHLYLVIICNNSSKVVVRQNLLTFDFVFAFRQRMFGHNLCHKVQVQKVASHDFPPAELSGGSRDKSIGHNSVRNWVDFKRWSLDQNLFSKILYHGNFPLSKCRIRPVLKIYLLYLYC